MAFCGSGAPSTAVLHPVRQEAPRYFATARAFRAWLERHSDVAEALVVGFYKVGTGRQSVTWSDAVDEALCFGWVDAGRHRIDDASYTIRFTPRRRGSTWSAVNIAKARALTEAGRMRPAGALAFARRTEKKSRTYSYEQASEPELTAEEQRRFGENGVAWAYFVKQAPGYRKQVLWWVVSAKRPTTRASRLTSLIEASAGGRRL